MVFAAGLVVAAADIVAQRVPHTVAAVGLEPICTPNAINPFLITDFFFYKLITLPAERQHPSGGSAGPAAATHIGAAAGRPTRPARRWVWPRLAGRQRLGRLVRSTVVSRTDQSAAGAGRVLRWLSADRGPR